MSDEYKPSESREKIIAKIDQMIEMAEKGEQVSIYDLCYIKGFIKGCFKIIDISLGGGA